MRGIVGILMAIVLAIGSHAQSYIDQFPPVTLPNTEVHTLHSTRNGQTYKLYIAVPVNYESFRDKKFPVLYTLDADYSFALIKNIGDHLNERNNLEGMIVVGIAYAGPNQYRLNRTRDYTPQFSMEGGYGPEFQKHTGGGPMFVKFLEEELIPYISKNFRVSNVRALSGHSYGGLFATWVLFTRPDLFQKYLIVSPSLWFDNNFMFAEETRNMKQNAGIDARVYMSVGSQESSVMTNDLRNFAKQVEGHHYARLKMVWAVEEGENHNTIYPIALTKGLRFLFP